VEIHDLIGDNNKQQHVAGAAQVAHNDIANPGMNSNTLAPPNDTVLVTHFHGTLAHCLRMKKQAHFISGRSVQQVLRCVPLLVFCHCAGLASLNFETPARDTPTNERGEVKESFVQGQHLLFLEVDAAPG
jgi:hypothetical protein